MNITPINTEQCLCYKSNNINQAVFMTSPHTTGVVVMATPRTVNAKI